MQQTTDHSVISFGPYKMEPGGAKELYSPVGQVEGQLLMYGQEAGTQDRVLLRLLVMDADTLSSVRNSILSTKQGALAFRHPALLSMKDIRLEEGGMLTVQSLPPGPLLRQSLTKAGNFPWHDAIVAMRPFFHALYEARAQGFSISLISPDDLSLDGHEGFGRRRIVCLAPLLPSGWSLEVSDKAFEKPLLAGTSEGHSDLDLALYSSAAVIIYMITGRTPKAPETWQNILKGAKVPNEVESMLLAMLKGQTEKFSTTSDNVMGWIDRVLEKKDSSSITNERENGTKTPARNRATLAIAGVVTCLLAFGFFAWSGVHFYSNSSPPLPNEESLEKTEPTSSSLDSMPAQPPEVIPSAQTKADVVEPAPPLKKEINEPAEPPRSSSATDKVEIIQFLPEPQLSEVSLAEYPAPSPSSAQKKLISKARAAKGTEKLRLYDEILQSSPRNREALREWITLSLINNPVYRNSVTRNLILERASVLTEMGDPAGPYSSGYLFLQDAAAANSIRGARTALTNAIEDLEQAVDKKYVHAALLLIQACMNLHNLEFQTGNAAAALEASNQMFVALQELPDAVTSEDLYSLAENLQMALKDRQKNNDPHPQVTFLQSLIVKLKETAAERK